MKGTVATLSAQDIQARSQDIFREGTFNEGYLRPAGYDLRISEHRIKTTGHVAMATLHLSKGQRAVVETFERVAIPWDVTANLGVKALWTLQGLFVTQGLFVDPGFGWSAVRSEDGDEGCEPKGAPLRFMITNMGNAPMAIKLGSSGDPVLGIQFFSVDPPTVRHVVPERDAEPQGLAVFEDMAQLERRVNEMSDRIHRTEATANQVVIFGVFLVAATILGVAFTFILASIASGHAIENLITAANKLDASHPWTAVILVVIVLVGIACVGATAREICRLYARMYLGRSRDHCGPLSAHSPTAADAINRST